MRRRLPAPLPPLALLLALLAAAGAGCGPGGAAGAGGAPPAAAPKRIVSLAPNLTETLFALGQGGRVVGVDDYSVWPPEVAGKARLGGLFNPNLERIVALRPDLAVALPSERDIADKLRRLGVDALIVPAESLADVERSFRSIAARCGEAPAGERLAAAWRAALAPRPVAGAPRVMLSVGRQPGRLAGMLAAARGTFLDELLRLLGGIDVFADSPSRYPQVGMEEVVARAPQVILELRSEPAPPAVVAALAADWRELPSVPAVRDGRIFVIAGDYVLVPGPRLPDLYRRMREALTAAGRPRATVRPGGGPAAAAANGARPAKAPR
jgi:iron complex transport system substrate-binding protein